MAQQGAPGWQTGQTDSNPDESNINSNAGHFAAHPENNSGLYPGDVTDRPYQHRGLTAESNSFQQGQNQAQRQARNLNLPYGAHNVGPLGSTQIAHNGNYQSPNAALTGGQRQNIQQYHGQSYMEQYPGMRQAQANNGQSDTQSGSLRQRNPPNGTIYQPSQGSGGFQHDSRVSSVPAGTGAHPVGQSDHQTQRTGAASSSRTPDLIPPADATRTAVSGGEPREWKLVAGCPNLLVGAAPVRRQVVTTVATIKPHIAGENRNRTPLLPLKGNLPCEVLRERLRPLNDELARVIDALEVSNRHLKDAGNKPAQRTKYAEEVDKLETKKASLEAEKKAVSTGKIVAPKAGQSSPTVSPDASNEPKEVDCRQIQTNRIMAKTKRPTDLLEAVEYDVTRLLEQKPDDNESLSQAEKEDALSRAIGQKVADVGKYILDLCAEAKMVKDHGTALKSQLPGPLMKKHDLIRVAVQTALAYGDEDTLRNMGGYAKLMAGLTATLLREFSFKVFSSSTQLNILAFLAQASLMDMDTFRRTKLAVTLEKNRGALNDQCKGFVDRIAKNAEERTAKNSAEKLAATTSQSKQKFVENTADDSASKPTLTTKTPYSQASASTVPESARKETKSYLGLVSARKVAVGEKGAIVAPPKRSREIEDDTRGTKRVAVPDATQSSLDADTARPVPVAKSNNGRAPTRPTGSSLLNKSRRPPPKQPTQPAQNQLNRTTIGGLLDEIARPTRQVIPPPAQPVLPPETPEEKARRLRKESRRGRTVRWKSDAELVQVKIFERDSNEIEGRASNMVKDAKDNRQEGRMFKRQINPEIVEGDDFSPSELEIRPWVGLTCIDFSLIDDEQREKNFTTRGGFCPIDSKEKDIMDERERTELMVVYTDRSEIPPTPKSPPRASSPGSYVQHRHPYPDFSSPIVRDRLTGLSELATPGPAGAREALPRRMVDPRLSRSTSTTHRHPPSNISPTQPQNIVAQPSPSTISRAPASTAPQTPTSALTQQQQQQQRDDSVLALLQSDAAKNWVDPEPSDPANPKVIEPDASWDKSVLDSFNCLKAAVEASKKVTLESTLADLKAKYLVPTASGNADHSLADTEMSGVPTAAPNAHYPPPTQQHNETYTQSRLYQQLVSLVQAELPQVNAAVAALQSRFPPPAQPVTPQEELTPDLAAKIMRQVQVIKHRREQGETEDATALFFTKACRYWARGGCKYGYECTFRHYPKDFNTDH
ncbi:hypothetical protein GGR50DRAFT_427655 [Xylaria sp. CBS 124048]|nr:hypothetical protein GGR50DRAFT_427655 [Xylaria sp. CBS 124048]